MSDEKLVYCPLCKCALRQDRKNNHLIKCHLLGYKEFLSDAIKCFDNSSSDFCKCPHCETLIKKSKIAGHFKRVHNNIYFSNDPFLKTEKLPNKIIRNLPNQFLPNDKKLPDSTEKCVCGLRIGFISDDSGIYRAYNIGIRGFLTDKHICDGDDRSNSVFAFNAGIVDSNRSRH